MSKTQHTRGPWEIRDGSFIDAPSMTCVANVRGAHVTDQFECQANARLIAAAPDLAFALEALLEYAQDTMPEELDGSLDVWTQARTALAKAGME
jgi:hypothetical protein